MPPDEIVGRSDIPARSCGFRTGVAKPLSSLTFIWGAPTQKSTRSPPHPTDSAEPYDESTTPRPLLQRPGNSPGTRNDGTSVAHSKNCSDGCALESWLFLAFPSDRSTAPSNLVPPKPSKSCNSCRQDAPGIRARHGSRENSAASVSITAVLQMGTLSVGRHATMPCAITRNGERFLPPSERPRRGAPKPPSETEALPLPGAGTQGESNRRRREAQRSPSPPAAT